MAIISQESFEKLTEEEKKKIRKIYKDMKDEPSLAYANEYAEKCEWLETYFGKENLQPKPKIKTWKDMKEEYMLNADTGTSYIIDMDKKFYSKKLALKSLATLQIAKLIELGYGGMITDEEWKDGSNLKYCIIYSPAHNDSKINIIGCSGAIKHFIAFHTKQQAKEFMSYSENRKLVEQYYMI